MTIVVKTIDPSSDRNYAWLQSEIASWLHREDLAARIPSFIMLGEQRVNRLAKVREMEVEAALTAEVGSRYIALPTDFSVPLGAWLETVQPRKPLTMTVPEQLAVTADAGPPSFFAIDGTNIAFERPADAAHQVTLRYRGKFELSDANQTNALLMQYPDLYLYASLLAAAPWIRDVAMVTLWSEMFSAAIKEINANAARARTSATLRTDLPQVLCARGYDINRG
jgi:hypothetical protein